MITISSPLLGGRPGGGLDLSTFHTLEEREKLNLVVKSSIRTRGDTKSS